MTFVHSILYIRSTMLVSLSVTCCAGRQNLYAARPYIPRCMNEHLPTCTCDSISVVFIGVFNDLHRFVLTSFCGAVFDAVLFSAIYMMPLWLYLQHLQIAVHAVKCLVQATLQYRYVAVLHLQAAEGIIFLFVHVTAACTFAGIGDTAAVNDLKHS